MYLLPGLVPSLPLLTVPPLPQPHRDGKPRVRWSHFFDVEPVGWGEGGRGGPTIHLHASALRHPAVQAYLSRRECQKKQTGGWLLGVG